jgi:hypothetical protein
MHVGLDYDSATKADTSRQNFTVAPRHWYVDVNVRCERCGEVFRFTAAEQKTWYEEYNFYVDSFPRHCRACRGERRKVKRLRQEYDRDIATALTSSDLDLKIRVATVVDELRDAGETLPERALENRRTLAKQLARHSRTRSAS